MLFSYTAARKDGTHYDGTFEAADKFALYKELHGRGETVLSVNENGTKPSLWKRLANIKIGGVKQDDRIMFAKNLGAMIRAGLPLSRALSVLSRQMNKKQWVEIFSALQDSLSKGSSFSQALAAFPKVFPPFLTSMVAVGEESGSLAQSLSIVADQLEKSHNLQKKVRGAMIYPIIILSVMVLIGVMMFIFVVPKLTATFASFNTQLPLPTRVIIGTSNFLGAHWFVMLIIVIILAIALVASAKTAPGKKAIHKLILKLPITGKIAVEINTARTARTLSSMLASGVDVVGALRITGDVVQNVHYRAMLKQAAEDIQKGATLQSLFAPREDIYPAFISEMIGVGEETGTLSKTLLEVATFYENEVDEKTKDMSTIIEPILMVVIGAGVGFFALAMITPIYSLSSTIS
ncbi:MAG TPA: type II secretion system F family protein [Candidatus Paceibacterota bacterium]|nr:type II secretion system F family protein [Candidatus Paceibacterota bacterium]